VDKQDCIDAANLPTRCIWHLGNILTLDYQPAQYEVIVLNEVCHTLPAAQLPDWLIQLGHRIKPEGFLLIADMLLNNNYTGPLRHLLAGVKLFVSGGGLLMNMAEYEEHLQQAILLWCRLYRLPTTDLVIAHASQMPPPTWIERVSSYYLFTKLIQFMQIRALRPHQQHSDHVASVA